MKFNRILLGFLSVLVFYSCQNDDDYAIPSEDAIEFSSQVHQNGIVTRATNSSWTANDLIGIFMKNEGSNLSEQSVIDFGSNKTYTTTGNGIFKALSSSESLYFPKNDSKVDFIAYYPHQENLNNFIYKVDVTDQSDLEKIDLLYSDNLKSLNKSSSSKEFLFTHQLTTVRLNIETQGKEISLDKLEVILSGAKSRADFDLRNGTLTVDENSVTPIQFKTVLNSNSAYAEAILMPDNGGSGRVLTFTLPNSSTPFKWKIDSSIKFEKGKKYTFSIKLDASGIVVEENFGWMETPQIKNTPSKMMYVTHMMADNGSERNYSLYYDTEYKFAHWVAYPLHKSHMGGSKRTNDWKYDPSIPNSFQPNIRKAFDPSTYSRGHQIASADRTRSTSINRQTFYYSNMTPQLSNNFNSSIWAKLEDQVRSWATALSVSNGNDTLYVVTGVSVLEGAPLKYAKDNDGVNITVPDYYYKALAKQVKGTYYTIAFKMDHKNYGNSNYNEYRITVQDLEKATGYTFFPRIPKDAKSQIVSSQW